MPYHLLSGVHIRSNWSWLNESRYRTTSERCHVRSQGLSYFIVQTTADDVDYIFMICIKWRDCWAALKWNRDLIHPYAISDTKKIMFAFHRTRNAAAFICGWPLNFPIRDGVFYHIPYNLGILVNSFTVYKHYMQIWRSNRPSAAQLV